MSQVPSATALWSLFLPSSATGTATSPTTGCAWMAPVWPDPDSNRAEEEAGFYSGLCSWCNTKTGRQQSTLPLGPYKLGEWICLSLSKKYFEPVGWKPLCKCLLCIMRHYSCFWALSRSYALSQPQQYFLNHGISVENKLSSHLLGREKNDPGSGSKHSLHLVTVSSRGKEAVWAYCSVQ